MNWDNDGEWHIDYISPLANAKNQLELTGLCHYTNLKPLWALDNIKKGNKYMGVTTSTILTNGKTNRTYRDSNGKRKRFNTYHTQHGSTYGILQFSYRWFDGEDDNNKKKIHVGKLNNNK